MRNTRIRFFINTQRFLTNNKIKFTCTEDFNRTFEVMFLETSEHNESETDIIFRKETTLSNTERPLMNLAFEWIGENEY